MVGVPGRSRACLTCKKRRIACDLQQPNCQRCTKAQRKCEYAQDRIFVLNDEGSHKTVYKKSCSEPRDSGSGRSDGSAPDEGTPAQQDGLPKKRQVLSPIDGMAQPTQLYKAPPDGIFLRQALLSRAISDGNKNLANRVTKPSTFTGTIANALASGIAGSIQSPFLACYTAWIGRLQEDARLTDASHEFYIHGLHETHKALSNPKTAFSDPTLAACNALGIYEALECPGGSMSGYHWHRAASYRLIRLRGPRAFQDGVAHHLFTSFRLFGILLAFDNGHPTYLSSREWTTIPWRIHPKTTTDELIDILALGPEVVSQGNRVPELAPDQLFATAIEILNKLCNINDKLQKFYNRYEQSHDPAPLYWEQISPTRVDAPWSDLNENSFLTFPPSLCFPDLLTAGTLTLYWAMQALVWGGLADLYSLFEEHGMAHLLDAALRTPTPCTPQSLQSLWLDPCRKVCQSVAFCSSATALLSGPPCMSTQLAIVTDVMKTRTGAKAEYEWALRAGRQMGAKWLRIFKVGFETWDASRGHDGKSELSQNVEW